MKKVLFFTVNQDDYLSCCILHGFRQISGVEVVDFPKKESLYKTSAIPNDQIYGRGFTLFKTLDDIEIDRRDIRSKITEGYFDLIVFSDFSEQFGYYLSYYESINLKKTVILDGDDSPKIFPYYGKYWRKFPFQFLHISFDIPVFKREWTSKTLKYRSFLLLPDFITSYFYKKMKLNKISFGIPEEKIIKNLPIKKKLFGSHIVDDEIVSRLKTGNSTYVFDNEKDYYNDLQISKYGITTKRAGWDAMRHYEIAANGAVICFRDLNEKPKMCAPHDLVPGVNCINYTSYDDLMSQIEHINSKEYEILQNNSLTWIKSKTTKNLAQNILNIIQS